MKKPNSSTIPGFICCFGMVLFGIATNGGIKTILSFIHFPSMVVTFGGAIFAVMITSESFADFVDGLKSFGTALSKRNAGIDEVANLIYELSLLARKEGLLALEEKASELQHPFLEKGVRLIVDGTDQELLRDILETDLMHQIEDNRRRITFWENLGSYAPAWGMVGTLIGLINMMKTMGADSSAIGAGMSLALITTLYGSIIANWICIPISRKLEKKSDAEYLVKEIIVEGVLSIQAGENTRIIKEKIQAIVNKENEN